MTLELSPYVDREILQPPPAPLPDRYRSAGGLVRGALLLDDDVYTVARYDSSPVGLGFKVLLGIVGIVVAARLIGLGLGLLTSPQLGSLQASILNAIAGMSWYQQQVQQTPGFAEQFQSGYNLFWTALQTLLGIPTPGVTIGSLITFAILTFVNWIGYGVLVHLLARWFRGEATFSQFLAPLALSYAPLLLFVVELVPGAFVPITLMFLLLLAFKFMAIRHTYGLHPMAGLAVTVGPYLLVAVATLAVALISLALGLNQIPVLGPFLRQAGRMPFFDFGF
jgi:hypothetical protein